jgi:glycosyltransferase involved in cell wall biosynthesis
MSLYEYLDAQALKRMDCTVAVSSDVAGNLISRGLKEEKIRVVHNGLKVCDITQHIDKNRVRENYGIAPDIMTFGTLGRLARIKGHEVLIRAMPSIVREIGACKLVIGGDGPLNNYLEELVKDLHLEDYVSMVGYVQNVGEFLSMIDVFILPSLSEGLPISLLEAMASGKPVVASSVGGITEVITTSEQGALVVPGDPVVIARAVTELLRDPARMKKMGAEGRQVIRERFSAEIMAKNYLNLYSTMYYDA